MNTTARRSDAARSYGRIVAAAETVVAREGANASLEEIARQAGVGSATLHRHFPSRWALLEAVFSERVDAICARVADDTIELFDWLKLLTEESAVNRGLAASMLHGKLQPPSETTHSCHQKITEAGRELLDRAQRAHRVRDGVTIDDVLTLVSAVVLATESSQDPRAESNRVISLALEGVRISHL